MGGWFSHLWNSFFGFKEFKLVIIGLNNAGKTTILYKMLTDEVVVTVPTIGANVEELVYKKLKFYCWDVGGQNILRSSWDNYYTDTNVLIFVIDSSDKDRIILCKEELERALFNELLAHVKILIFANKNDISGALSTAEISEILKLSEIRTHEWQIQSCCALTGDGINKGMDWVAEKINLKETN